MTVGGPRVKLILRNIVKRCLILIISFNFAFLSPVGQFLTGAKLLLGTPKYEKNVFKIYTCLGFVKMHGCGGNLKCES